MSVNAHLLHTWQYRPAHGAQHTTSEHIASELGKQFALASIYRNVATTLNDIGSIALGYASAHPHTVKPRKEDYYKIV